MPKFLNIFSKEEIPKDKEIQEEVKKSQIEKITPNTGLEDHTTNSIETDDPLAVVVEETESKTYGDGLLRDALALFKAELDIRVAQGKIAEDEVDKIYEVVADGEKKDILKERLIKNFEDGEDKTKEEIDRILKSEGIF